MMEYKPHILTLSKFNPPDEVKAAAKQLACKGLKGEIGDPLPEALSSTALYWINRNKHSFRHLVYMKRREWIHSFPGWYWVGDTWTGKLIPDLKRDAE